MITRSKTSMFLTALFALGFLTAGNAQAGKPTVGSPCQKCHTGQEDAVRGRLGKVSPDFKTMQVKVGKLTWIIKYDDKTSVVKGDKTLGADEITNLPAKKEVLVSF